MTRFSISITVLGMIVLFSTWGHTRIANTQDTLFSIQKDGLYLHSDLSLDWITGTAEVIQFSGSQGSQFLLEPHILFLTASGTFAKKDDDRYLNQYFGHLRYRYRIWKMIMAELFAQGEYNEFRRILVRLPLGVGPRIQRDFGTGRLLQLAFGTSYMFELVHLSEDSDAQGNRYDDSLEYEHNHRWNNYLAFKVNAGFVSLGATVYMQPELTDFNDWMLLVESELSFKITDYLALSITYTLFRDSKPPQGVINQDTALKTVLKFSFGPWLPQEARTDPAPSP